jgi:hypothetical protein
MTDAEQMDLFGQEIVAVSHSRKATIEERFAAFDAANPHIYTALVYLAYQIKDTGVSRISVKHLLEVVRYNRRIVTKSDDGVKINNDFSAMYGRKIISTDSHLAPFFETRVRRAA